MSHSVILVYSTSYAIKGERLLKKAGIPCKLTPVPRHLSSDCGVCLRVETADKPAILAVITDTQLPYDRWEDL